MRVVTGRVLDLDVAVAFAGRACALAHHQDHLP